ncbi:carboxypeptidase-like regulatory domain-containing protein [Albibacterium bauzanense]|uniref:Carboxypeptidase-like protein n=1 Tax=Albibacterium bauzanense TaxID=653929 RepID=A0A4R1LV00_9SPHI|nr:carboxypeptidase-like regulatory domain-containing protein [Albibacterium bauzanense]TCK83188.1 carboxypeptidase-like protein [Albibacterium bauzanense]
MKSLNLLNYLLSFTLVKKLGLFISFIFYSGFLLAQQETDGLVYDEGTKQRIAKVYIYNTNSDTGTFSNLKGEFHLKVSDGDVLIAAVEGYFPDTLTFRNESAILIYLKRSSTLLREVTIIARRSPEELLKEKKEDYNTAYSKGDPGPLFSVGNTGAGLSIGALYSLLSKEGKNARYLQEIIERDYQNDIIDYRFTPELVTALTGLRDKDLDDFMMQYRPSYYFILASNDYSLALYIRSSYQDYRRNPYLRRLPPLKEELQSP